MPATVGNGWFSDVATDVAGNVYVCWSSGVDSYDAVVCAFSTDKGDWSTPNDVVVVPSNGYVTRPSLLADGSADHPMLHMGFRGETLQYATSPLQTALSALSWQKPLNVVPGGYFSKIVKSRSNRIHLLFTQNYVENGCENCFHLMGQYTDDGISWSSPVDISLVRGGTAKPQAVVDQANRIHVVFEVGYGGDLGQLEDPATVMYTVSHDGGESWQTPVRLDPSRGDSTDAQARNVTIGLSEQGELIAVWWGIPDDLVYYQISKDHGQAWSRPVPIPNLWGIWSVYNSRLDSYSMATDGAGQLHLVMVGRTQATDTELAVLHLVWDGAQWSRPEVIAVYSGDVPEWPRIAIGNGNRLHLVWFVRNQADVWSGGGDYTVWYAQGTAAAPYIAPVPLPTLEPMALAAPKSTAREPYSTTRVATGEMIAPAMSLAPELQVRPAHVVTIGALMTETDDVVLLAKSLLPVLFLVGVTFMALRRRRDPE